MNIVRSTCHCCVNSNKPQCLRNKVKLLLKFCDKKRATAYVQVKVPLSRISDISLFVKLQQFILAYDEQ